MHLKCQLQINRNHHNILYVLQQVEKTIASHFLLMWWQILCFDECTPRHPVFILFLYFLYSEHARDAASNQREGSDHFLRLVETEKIGYDPLACSRITELSEMFDALIYLFGLFESFTHCQCQFRRLVRVVLVCEWIHTPAYEEDVSWSDGPSTWITSIPTARRMCPISALTMSELSSEGLDLSVFSMLFRCIHSCSQNWPLGTGSPETHVGVVFQRGLDPEGEGGGAGTGRRP